MSYNYGILNWTRKTQLNGRPFEMIIRFWLPLSSPNVRFHRQNQQLFNCTYFLTVLLTVWKQLSTRHSKRIRTNNAGTTIKGVTTNSVTDTRNSIPTHYKSNAEERLCGSVRRFHFTVTLVLEDLERNNWRTEIDEFH